jgi:hypothetical protein
MCYGCIMFNIHVYKANCYSWFIFLTGHDLEEIRVRAFENLLSKLEHKLICDADLIHERHLLIRIVEWFNFPNSTRHADVLKLLLRLTQVCVQCVHVENCTSLISTLKAMYIYCNVLLRKIVKVLTKTWCNLVIYLAVIAQYYVVCT